MKVHLCKNETPLFIGFYAGHTKGNDNQVALKLYKKYKSVRLYLHFRMYKHWPYMFGECIPAFDEILKSTFYIYLLPQKKTNVYRL